MRITRFRNQTTPKHELTPARASERAAAMAPGAGDAAQREASCFFFLDGGGEVINDGMD